MPDDLKQRNQTHVKRRWGTPQNFFLAFMAELEKQIFINIGPLLKWANKKQNKFNI